MLHSPAPCFIDFEASSFSGQSFPIEVAWGCSGQGIESCLINIRECSDCADWDDASELVHGIARRELLEKGLSMPRVCDRLDVELTGRRVYSDAPGYDNFWLEKLYYLADRGMPGFAIRHIDDLLCEVLAGHHLQRDQLIATIVEAKQQARALVPGRHRASWDVRYLMETWRLIRDYRPSASVRPFC